MINLIHRGDEGWVDEFIVIPDKELKSYEEDDYYVPFEVKAEEYNEFEKARKRYYKLAEKLVEKAYKARGLC